MLNKATPPFSKATHNLFTLSVASPMTVTGMVALSAIVQCHHPTVKVALLEPDIPLHVCYRIVNYMTNMPRPWSLAIITVSHPVV